MNRLRDCATTNPHVSFSRTNWDEHWFWVVQCLRSENVYYVYRFKADKAVNPEMVQR